MATDLYVAHPFLSQKSDGGDPTQVQPSNWNDGHAFRGGAVGDALVRDPAEYYGAKWLSVGKWIDVPYAASNFSGTGTMVWTVTSGNQASYAYMVLGRTVFVQLNLTGTTVSGAPGQPFNVTLPAGVTPIRAVETVGYSIDAGLTGQPVRIRLAAGDPKFYLSRVDFANWAISAGLTNLSMEFFYQI